MKSRVLGLDILRTFAIILVCLIHGREIIAKFYPLFPNIWFVDGVDLFFTLSGFLIGTIFIREFTQLNKIRIFNLFHFWKRRWFRTLPLYFFILILNIVLYFIENGNIKIEGLWKYFFFLQNFSIVECYHFFTESWSLAVEEWFYLTFPLIVLIVSHFLKGKIKISIFVSCILILFITIIFRNLYGLSLEDMNIWDWIKLVRNVVIFRMDSIIFGVLGAHISIYYSNFWNKYKFLFFALGLTGIFLNYFYNPLQTNFEMVNSDFISSSSILLLFPYLSNLKSCKFDFVNQVFSFISKISYSMYMVNFSIVLKYLNKFSPALNSELAIINYCLFWFFTISISYILYNFFERPITDLRDKY